MTESLPAGRCPDPEAVAAFVCGELSPSSRGALVSHVERCSSCRELVSALVHLEHPADRQLRSMSPASRASACAGDIQPANGATVGRYVVLNRLGEGGMGVVYAARDPELDRKVALKLLRGDFSQIAQGSLHRRLLQEAQAMARMAHPNVVTVYDVGTWRNRIFIAMEIVEGQTLGEWLAGGPRFWREIVAMFLPAGHGLAAAHASGLVHRDFKPASVFIGSDGRVRVGDFGLAATGATGPRTTDADHGELAATADSQSAVGSMAGTPYYMAPEELLGDPTDARSDQFSFCVALYAAITGLHPFAGDSIEEWIGRTKREIRRSASSTACSGGDASARRNAESVGESELWIRRACHRPAHARSPVAAEGAPAPARGNGARAEPEATPWQPRQPGAGSGNKGRSDSRYKRQSRAERGPGRACRRTRGSGGSYGPLRAG
jgi:Protein kinase domain